MLIGDSDLCMQWWAMCMACLSQAISSDSTTPVGNRRCRVFMSVANGVLCELTLTLCMSMVSDYGLQTGCIESALAC